MTNEHSEQQNDFMTEFDAKAQAAAQAFKAAVSAAEERQAQYGHDPAEAIDVAKAELESAAAQITADYEERLSAELTKAKQAAMSSGSISKAERQAAEDFISDVRLQLAISSADNVTQLLNGMADVLTGKQRSYVLKQLAGDLQAAGVDVRSLATVYADEQASGAYARIQQLEAMRTEDAALAITTIIRTNRAYLDKSKTKYQH